MNWNCSRVLTNSRWATWSPKKSQSNTLQCKINIHWNTTGATNLPYIIQTPVSCRKRKRLTLNNHTVRTVIINKNIITSRNTVSIALYFFSFSAASFSFALSASSSFVSTITKSKTKREQNLTNNFPSAAILMQSARWQVSIQAPWVNLNPRPFRFSWRALWILCERKQLWRDFGNRLDIACVLGVWQQSTTFFSLICNICLLINSALNKHGSAKYNDVFFYYYFRTLKNA